MEIHRTRGASYGVWEFCVGVFRVVENEASADRGRMTYGEGPEEQRPNSGVILNTGSKFEIYFYFYF